MYKFVIVYLIFVASGFAEISEVKCNTPKYITDNEPKSDINIRKLKPVSSNAPSGSANLFDNKLTVGNVVMHERFGKGEVINLEGVGADKKAEIKFEVGGIKKLLLRFAKLDVIG